MKRLVSIWIFLVVGLVGYGQFNSGTITLDGDNTESAYVNQGNWSIAWDNNYLYLVKKYGNVNEPAIVYIDINTGTSAVSGNNSNGTIFGRSDWDITPNLPFRADFRLYWTYNYAEYSLDDGSGGWGSNVVINTSEHEYNSTYNSDREIRIAWDSFGLSNRPDRFNIIGFCSTVSSLLSCSGSTSVGCIYDQFPDNNPAGDCGISNNCYRIPNFEYYWHAKNTTASGATNPFDYKCYTYLGSGGSLGTISNIYNFTHFKNLVINKSNKWDYAGSLILDGNGARIEFDSNPDSLKVGDSLVILNGQLLLETSTSEILVNKAIGIYDTLVGSSDFESSIKLKGNFRNSSYFISNNTKFIFNGTSVAQTISGDVDGVNAFGRLEINNSNGLVDNSDDSLTIEDTLFLTDGVIQAKKYVVLRNGAGVLPLTGDADSYVDSVIIWEMYDTDSTVFPVGDDGEWAPIGLKPFNSTSGRLYKSSYSKAGYSNFSVSTTCSLKHASWVEYWNLDELSSATGSNKACQVSLYWRDYSEVSSTSNDWDSLKVCHYNGSDWEEVDCQPNSISSGATSSFGVVKTLSYTSDFSPFTIGTTITNNPLPVNLTSFDAHLSKNQQAIDLNWTTASELNCARFVLQKKNEDHWQTISEQHCNAVSNELLHYDFTDFDVQSSNQYRLLQIDLDGEEAIYGPVMVDVSQTKFKIVPNPANSYFTVSNSHKIRTITIIDAFGNIVDTSQADHRFNTQSLRAGVYNILIVDKSGVTHTQRLVVMH